MLFKNQRIIEKKRSYENGAESPQRNRFDDSKCGENCER